MRHAEETLTAVEQQQGRASVSIWALSLDLDGAALVEASRLLTPAEQRRADRGTPIVRRRRMALRAALRVVVGQTVGCRPADVRLAETAAGRPHLAVPWGGVDISCATAGDFGLVAVARNIRIGIDVETVRAWKADVAAEGWLSPSEVELVRELSPDGRAEGATRAWTRKEAVLKAVGCGLALPPALIDVSAGDRSQVGEWIMEQVRVPVGLVATLACSAPIAHPGPALVPHRFPATAWSVRADARRVS